MLDHDFRAANPADTSVVIKSCDIEVALRPQGAGGEYRYTYTVTTTSDLIDWFHDIPGPRGNSKVLSATDAEGTLQTDVEERDGTTRLHIRLRRPTAREHTFSFSYSTSVIALLFPGVFRQRVVYSDSFVNDSACEQLRVRVVLPPKSVATASNPAVTHGADGLSFSATRMRALDDLTFLVAYREARIGRPFWLWLASTVVSTLMGVFATWLTTP